VFQFEARDVARLQTVITDLLDARTGSICPSEAAGRGMARAGADPPRQAVITA
jgi:hypothetical protein